MNDHDIFEVYLAPGEFYWGDRFVRLKTLLGSCVAITMWHPKLKIGGLSHSLLPEAPKNERRPGLLNARYVDQAIDFFELQICKSNTKCSDYVIKIFGGGSILRAKEKTDDFKIGERNILMARKILTERGFKIYSEHTGGTNSRNVILDISTGKTWLRSININEQ